MAVGTLLSGTYAFLKRRAAGSQRQRRRAPADHHADHPVFEPLYTPLWTPFNWMPWP